MRRWRQNCSHLWRALSGPWRRHESTEGTDYPRNVIVEWPDMETAQKAYHSAEYAHAKQVLGDGADRLFVIIEGLEG